VEDQTGNVERRVEGTSGTESPMSEIEKCRRQDSTR
jgi:hypothetical protein